MKEKAIKIIMIIIQAIADILISSRGKKSKGGNKS
jgi:hypothetical protein